MVIVFAFQVSALSYPSLNILFKLPLTTRGTESSYSRPKAIQSCIVGGFHPN